MKIELKNIRHYPSMSEETECYQAALYVDGVKIGEVSNRGHGGCDDFHGDRKRFEEAEAWVAANTTYECPFDKKPRPHSMETFCGDLLTEHLIRKDFRKACKSKVLFLRPAMVGVFQMSFKGVRKVDDRHIRHVEAKYPAATILNRLPEDEAVHLYRTNG